MANSPSSDPQLAAGMVRRRSSLTTTTPPCNNDLKRVHRQQHPDPAGVRLQRDAPPAYPIGALARRGCGNRALAPIDGNAPPTSERNVSNVTQFLAVEILR